MKAVEQILVEQKSVYGNQLVYPVCTAAKAFIKALGRKTLTAADILAVKALGIRVFLTANGVKVGEL